MPDTAFALSPLQSAMEAAAPGSEVEALAKAANAAEANLVDTEPATQRFWRVKVDPAQ